MKTADRLVTLLIVSCAFAVTGAVAALFVSGALAWVSVLASAFALFLAAQAGGIARSMRSKLGAEPEELTKLARDIAEGRLATIDGLGGSSTAAHGRSADASGALKRAAVRVSGMVSDSRSGYQRIIASILRLEDATLRARMSCNAKVFDEIADEVDLILSSSTEALSRLVGYCVAPPPAIDVSALCSSLEQEPAADGTRAAELPSRAQLALLPRSQSHGAVSVAQSRRGDASSTRRASLRLLREDGAAAAPTT